MDPKEFFSTARERYHIRLRRLQSQNPPWTIDPVFQKWFFCNVHREHDKTTVWFRENIRNHLNGLGVIEATVIFRWFNRIGTCEKIMDLILGEWDPVEARNRLKNVRPVVTGAYMVKGVSYLPKLEGVIAAIGKVLPLLPDLKIDKYSLQNTWKEIRELPLVGGFTAYEIITDLRWTDVLRNATDTNTWANAGPGCARGLEWLTGHHYNRNSQYDQEAMNRMMRELLLLSREERHWPQNWDSWEMREVEHWLCEYSKYKKAQTGVRLKRRYK